MANAITLKMDGKTTKSGNTLQPPTLHKGGTWIHHPSKNRPLSDPVMADSYFARQKIPCFMLRAKSLFFEQNTRNR
jgi:hypothetical protein